MSCPGTIATSRGFPTELECALLSRSNKNCFSYQQSKHIKFVSLWLSEALFPFTKLLVLKNCKRLNAIKRLFRIMIVPLMSPYKQ